MKRIIVQLGAYALALVTFWAIAWLVIHLWLGSWGAFVALARGESVLIEPATLTLDLKPNSEHEFVFTVRNLRSEPVQIVGARTGCTCVTTQTMPLELPAYGSITLTGKVFTDDSPDEFHQPVTFYAEAGGLVELPVLIAGQGSKRGR